MISMKIVHAEEESARMFACQEVIYMMNGALKDGTVEMYTVKETNERRGEKR